MNNIARVIEFQSCYVLYIVRIADGHFSWQIVRSDGVWMREIDASRDLADFDCALSAGRRALQNAVAHDAWLTEKGDAR